MSFSAETGIKYHVMTAFTEIIWYSRISHSGYATVGRTKDVLFGMCGKVKDSGSCNAVVWKALY